MSGESERTVTVTPLVIVEPDAAPKAKGDEGAKAAREARLVEREAHARRWKAIQEAGGSDAWVEAEIAAKGLAVDADPEADKASFKEKKKAEAAERRRLRQQIWQAYRATHVTHVGAGIYFRDEDVETNAEKEARLTRARENELSMLDSVEALAKALGVTPPTLRWMCFHREVESSSHYQFWTIAKRDGTRRLITAPKAELKAVQRWLLHNVFEKLPVHAAAHGFLAARSIASNAEMHAGAEVIVKIDIQDFFPTITFRRVKGLLVKSGLPENVATLCALLATEPPREVVEFRGKTLYVAKGPRSLPQGAPTSPAITNAICVRMDRRLSGLAKLFGFVYTRYADDLTFSFRSPSDAKGSRSPAPIGSLLRGVKDILAAEGFAVHDKKTTVMRAGQSQRVTGLVVNRPNADGVAKTRVPREVVRRLRAAIHNRERGKTTEKNESLAELEGLAAFVHMVDPKKGRAFLERIRALRAKR
jgi:RNA-directed DNA polymerase